MDFRETPEQKAFRLEVRKWLSQSLPEGWGTPAFRAPRSDADASSVRSVAASAGGHAMLYRGGARSGDVYHPLKPTLLVLHQRLKKAFDPKGILNPGRMYPQF